ARDARLHRDVAIKFLHPHLTQDSRRVDAFFDEARLVARLALPGVVRIYDLAPDDRVIIMEYLTRGTLRDRLASGRPLSLQAALRVAHALLTTLGRIHDAGLIHRDLKPENILFRSDNSAVLGDFGTAILEDDDRLLETRPAGTVAYMAPELKRPLPDHTPDRRVDLYSVGLVLVEMIAGVLPPAPAMAVHDPDLLISLLPSRARQLLDRPLRHLLAEDPAQRPSSALLIADDLARARQLLDQEAEDRRLLDDFQRLAHLDGDPDPATAAYLEMVTRELTRVEDAPQPGPEQF
ncbi:MAG: hypothetical protein CMH57_09990, partial [Myxococcales bacterium]|nr:hypothetical protein [Myxococcales bacterium]